MADRAVWEAWQEARAVADQAREIARKLKGLGTNEAKLEYREICGLGKALMVAIVAEDRLVAAALVLGLRRWMGQSAIRSSIRTADT